LTSKDFGVLLIFLIPKRIPIVCNWQNAQFFGYLWIKCRFWSDAKSSRLLLVQLVRIDSGPYGRAETMRGNTISVALRKGLECLVRKKDFLFILSLDDLRMRAEQARLKAMDIGIKRSKVAIAKAFVCPEGFTSVRAHR